MIPRDASYYIRRLSRLARIIADDRRSDERVQAGSVGCLAERKRERERERERERKREREKETERERERQRERERKRCQQLVRPCRPLSRRLTNWRIWMNHRSRVSAVVADGPA
jgi:hypothetical protein